MKKEMIEKLNQQDRIEYKIDMAKIDQDTDSTSIRQFLVLFSTLAVLILITLKNYQSAVIVMLIGFGLYPLLWILSLVSYTIKTIRLDKQYMERLDIKCKK